MSHSDFLIIDTSNYKPFVALITCGNLVAVSFLDANSLGSDLENSIENFLQKHSQINFIAVCSGPGNFSSIRTGVAFSLGLQISLNIPLVSWDSTIPFVSNSSKIFATIIDGGKKGCFFSIKEKVEKEVIVKSKPQFALFEQLEDFFQKNKIIYVTGPYLKNAKNFFENKEENYIFEEQEPDILFLKDFCSTLFQNKKYSDSVHVTYLKEIF